MAEKPLILLADDDRTVMGVMSTYLEKWNYRVRTVTGKAALFQDLEENPPDLLFLDLFFGEHNGIEILRALTQRDPHLPIILLTGNGSIDYAVAAMKFGAYDFLTKPPDFNRIEVCLRHALEKRNLQKHIQGLEKSLQPQDLAEKIRGESQAVKQLRETIATIAATDATVLLLGESGTGKELAARAIHEFSPRRQGPFVPVNMAALPQELVESILFGHEKGAFTGAERQHRGCCEIADQGTLFLDEIGDMSIQLQAKLLRFLQERTFQRVGGNENRSTDVRVVAATNRDLLQEVGQGRFREDLYYRLNVLPVSLPPLRDRRVDIPLLANYFLHRAALRYGKQVQGFTPAALNQLAQAEWRGNVRQLENLIERLVILVRESVIDVGALPREVVTHQPHPGEAITPVTESESLTSNRLEDLEKLALLKALKEASGNVGKAAQSLGIGRATAYRKMKRFGFMVP